MKHPSFALFTISVEHWYYYLAGGQKAKSSHTKIRLTVQHWMTHTIYWIWYWKYKNRMVICMCFHTTVKQKNLKSNHMKLENLLCLTCDVILSSTYFGWGFLSVDLEISSQLPFICALTMQGLRVLFVRWMNESSTDHGEPWLHSGRWLHISLCSDTSGQCSEQPPVISMIRKINKKTTKSVHAAKTHIWEELRANPSQGWGAWTCLNCCSPSPTEI